MKLSVFVISKFPNRLLKKFYLAKQSKKKKENEMDLKEFPEEISCILRCFRRRIDAFL